MPGSDAAAAAVAAAAVSAVSAVATAATAAVVVATVAVARNTREKVIRPPTRNISRFAPHSAAAQRPNSLQFRSRNYMRRGGRHLAGDARALRAMCSRGKI